jgi:cation transport regulator ChaC
MLAQIIAVHQQDFGTAIDYLRQSEAILRRIGSPDAETVSEILQQVERMAK